MNEKLIIPASIIIAGAMIGAAIYFGGGQSGQVASNDNYPSEQGAPAEVTSKKVDPASDRISGNPTAEIFVLEYSDLECPFCKRYHDTALSQLKTAYADDDRVAFVFRHFPLDEPYTQALHPTATEAHIAAECVGKLGGNDAFFSFVDDMFASDDSTDLSKLGERAVKAGVDRTSFQTCYDNQDTEPVVAAGFQEGVTAGVQGTPTVYIQTNEGKTFPAVPDYNALKISIDAYLAELQ